MMRLHCFGESGNAYKAALAMTVAGCEWEPVYVDFFNGGARTEAFRALNEMAEVPVLEDGELVLTQSGVILDYVSSKTGRLGGRSALERREILRWMFWDNHRLSGMIGPMRFLMNFVPPEKRPEAVIDWQQARLKSALKVLEAHLAGRSWTVGDAVTIADCSLAGYLYYPEPFGFDRSDWPAIDAWLDRLAAVPGWATPYDLMPGSPADRP